jgi:hypothetical protein
MAGKSPAMTKKRVISKSSFHHDVIRIVAGVLRPDRKLPS